MYVTPITHVGAPGAIAANLGVTRFDRLAVSAAQDVRLREVTVARTDRLVASRECGRGLIDSAAPGTHCSWGAEDVPPRDVDRGWFRSLQ